MNGKLGKLLWFEMYEENSDRIESDSVIHDFSLNSLNSETKIFVITVKVLKPATSCVRDQDATTVPARHM